MKEILRFFTGSIIVSVGGLLLGGALGFYYYGTVAAALGTLFIVTVLSVLEVSLSFDNAVVNATVLKQMTPIWRHRFLTWGIAIAVFGMRLIFPLAIVSILAEVSPLQALLLATTQPQEYARILTSARTVISAFGGSFLAMVSLKYFFDAEKDVHWIHAIEAKLTKLGRIEAIELAIVMLGLYGISRWLPREETASFLVAGLFGLVIYILVDGIGAALEVSEGQMADLHRASAAMFLYLEVLDASFSFDGVIGAFALTNNLFLISIGLGIGAMFVRSLTIMLVERGTLTAYRYLEHGAFYAIGALAGIMFLQTLVEVPEVVTGLIGAGFIGLAFRSSVRHNRAHRAQSEAARAAETPDLG